MKKMLIWCFVATMLWARPISGAVPIFVGTGGSQHATATGRALPFLSLIYMTAEQMAERVRGITGFYHPSFEEFAAILGTFDAKTGVRTNDRPTVMSVMILEQIGREIAESVVARELFLDQDDRVVFGGMDLTRIPHDVELQQLTHRLCVGWLGLSECPSALAQDLHQAFRQRESADLPGAWTGVVGTFLQVGTLYYY